MSRQRPRKRVRRMRRTGSPRGVPRIDGEQAAPAQTETTTMSMMRMAIHAVTTAKVIFTTITTLLGAAAPTGADSPVIPTLRAATPAELQWKGNRIAGKAWVVRQPMATPVEVRSLSELRWRRFSRLRGR